MKKALLLFGLLLSANSYAWNAIGHRIVAQIAEDNLTPCSKEQVQQLFNSLQKQYPTAKNLVLAADWMDNDNSDCSYASTDCWPPPKSWHFIQRPYTIGSAVNLTAAAEQSISAPNIVWAMQKYQGILSDPNSSQSDKAKALLILDHLLGDVSQPLHNLTGINQSFLLPDGDHGGNDYAINLTINCYDRRGHAYPHTIDNLHSYWDQGAGLFTCVSARKGWGQYVYDFANTQESQYQHNANFHALIQQSIANVNPASWSLQAYAYAQQVYQVPEDGAPSASYQAWAQGIVKQQLTLSGYRLANVLNQAFVANGMCQP